MEKLGRHCSFRVPSHTTRRQPVGSNKESDYPGVGMSESGRPETKLRCFEFYIVFALKVGFLDCHSFFKKIYTHKNKGKIMSMENLCCSHDTSFYRVRKYHLSLISFPLKIVVLIK